jgi:biotin-(acetyl-CoA carboxylase) ligase
MISNLAFPEFEEELFRTYELHLVTLGQRVLVSLPSGQIEGLAIRLERDGSLVILSDDREYSVFAGDVNSRKK